MRCLLLINPNARQGDSQIEQALDRLRDAGFNLIEPSAEVTDCSATIKEYAKGIDAVILGGGDGTMHAAAKALYETGLPMGLLPLGTANDLARTLKIPLDLNAAIDVIISGQLTEIDLGKVNGKLFFNAVQIGLAVVMAEEMTSELKQRWGPLGYIPAFFRARLKNRRFRVYFDTPGGQWDHKSAQLSIGNGRNYGGGMVLKDSSRIDDQLLDMCSLKSRSFWSLIWIALAMRRGFQGWFESVQLWTGKEISIRTSRPMDMTADGESIGQTPAEFSVLPRAVKVWVSQQYLDQLESKPE